MHTLKPVSVCLSHTYMPVHIHTCTHTHILKLEPKTLFWSQPYHTLRNLTSVIFINYHCTYMAHFSTDITCDFCGKTSQILP